jgi:geranylgeranyl diphosphate synthase type 3
MPKDSMQSPFASPNAIPPRTSSHGIVNGIKHRSSVLRPLSEIDWMSQSKKTKHSHSSTTPLRTSYSQAGMNPTQNHTNAYPTPHSPPPPDPPKANIGDELIYGNSNRWTDEKERILLGPYDYLYGHPGKDIRSQCIAAFNKWLRVPPERLEVITRVVGMLHTASLLYAHAHFCKLTMCPC